MLFCFTENFFYIKLFYIQDYLPTTRNMPYHQETLSQACVSTRLFQILLLVTLLQAILSIPLKSEFVL